MAVFKSLGWREPVRGASWVDRGKHRAAAGPADGGGEEGEARKSVSLKPWPGPVSPWRAGDSGKLP